MFYVCACVCLRSENPRLSNPNTESHIMILRPDETDQTKPNCVQLWPNQQKGEQGNDALQIVVSRVFFLFFGVRSLCCDLLLYLASCRSYLTLSRSA